MADQDDINKKLRDLANDDVVSCAQALEFADENDVAPREVGQRLTELGIKIVACQLGCFGVHRADRFKKDEPG